MFPIWWVSAAEWKAGDFKRKHVCKKCFETKVPNPHYYSVDEYLEDTDDFNEDAEIIQKNSPDLTLDEAKRFAIDFRIKLRAELIKIWR
jgi:hypothetical protein